MQPNFRTRAVPALILACFLILIVLRVSDRSFTEPPAPPSPEVTPPQAPSAAGGRPDVLLVTLDTTRADRIGAYGYRDGATPTIDRLAREGILFESAAAPTPITLPSHASILTGLYPVSHGVRDNALFVLAEDRVLVSEIFRAHGWRTGAFVAAVVLDPKWGLDQGFEVYRGPSLASGSDGTGSTRPADEVVSEAIGWLSGLGPGEPFFLWIHLFDPHQPYTAPQSWRRRVPDPYDAEIAFADAQIDRLLRFLERNGRTRNLLLALTADHGESLGDHGEETHGTFIYRATTHVPLVLWGRPLRTGLGTGPGTRVTRPVSIAAIAATLVESAGLEAGELPANALQSLLAPPGATTEQILLESYTPYYSYRWRALRGMIDGRYKIVEGRRTELYDLEADPAERTDLAPARSELAGQLQDRLHRAFDGHRGTGAAGGALGPGERARLEALGYSLGSAAGDPLGTELADPVERIADLESIKKARQLWTEAISLQRGGAARTPAQEKEQLRQARLKLESAKVLLEDVLAPPPLNPIALIELGLVENSLGNHARAIALMEQSVRDMPAVGRNRANLAYVYDEVGRHEDALRAMEQAIEVGPAYPSYFTWIVKRYETAGDLERAVYWLREALQELPEESSLRPEAQRRLGQLEAGGSGPAGSPH